MRARMSAMVAPWPVLAQAVMTLLRIVITPSLFVRA
jgi:hypothetical protein